MTDETQLHWHNPLARRTYRQSLPLVCLGREMRRLRVRASPGAVIFMPFSASEKKTYYFFFGYFYFVPEATAAIFENNGNLREEKSPKLREIFEI